MIKIIIVIASRGADIDYRLALNLARWCRDDKRVVDIVIQRNPFSAQEGQEAMLKDLEDKEFDYALVLDTDVWVELDAIDKLVDAGKDVCVAPVWHYNWVEKDIQLNVHYESILKRLYCAKTKGIEKIRSSSFACMMLSRKVFDAFKNAGESYTTGGDPMDQVSDNVFYTKLHRLGLEAWVRWDIKTSHYPRVELCDETIDHIIVRGILGRAGVEIEKA